METKNKDFNKDVFQAIEDYMKQNNWNHISNQEGGTVYGILGIKSAIRTLTIMFITHKQGFCTYALFPIGAERDKVTQIADFICRINSGMVVGNFEVDVDDGSIRFKNYVPCVEAPTAEMIESAYTLPAACVERYAKGFMEILFGDISPETAAAWCDGLIKTPKPLRNRRPGGDLPSFLAEEMKRREQDQVTESAEGKAVRSGDTSGEESAVNNGSGEFPDGMEVISSIEDLFAANKKISGDGSEA